MLHLLSYCYAAQELVTAAIVVARCVSGENGTTGIVTTAATATDEYKEYYNPKTIISSASTKASHFLAPPDEFFGIFIDFFLKFLI